jgi:hypothetical protein
MTREAWRHVVPVLAVLVSLFFCWWFWGRLPAVGNAAFAEPPAAEKRLIAQAIAEARGVVDHEATPDRLPKRDAHPYAHGCVRAWVKVRADIPRELQQGVFAKPGHAYPAWVRFSNGTRRDDTQPDARGMAIKLMGVGGKKLLDGEQDETTQDFVMINHHTFFTANVEEYLDFFQHQRRGDDFGYFIGLNPFRWHLFELVTGLELLGKQVNNPLESEYFSMLPFAFGAKQRVKFSAKPCDPTRGLESCEDRIVGVPGHGRDQAHPVERGAHFLRDALLRSLAFDEGSSAGPGERPAARFSFGVQLQKEGHAMPIEDASITWSEDASPYLPVADVMIPHQKFDSAEQNLFCENLSFNPWHSLPEHEPLGGLNRARREVYQAISRYRHEATGFERREPRDFCLRPDAESCSEAERTQVPR